MTDTRRDEAGLLALLQPGAARAISAQDLRDVVYSLFRPGRVDYTDPGSDPSHVAGRTYYRGGTFNVMRDVAGVVANLPEELQLPLARNAAGAVLPNGAAVYISGATGDNPTLGIASNDDATGLGTIGLVTHTIAENGFGYATTFGLVRDLDTSAWVEGTQLYLGTTGALTATIPTVPAHYISVGHVIRQHASEGEILVNVRRLPRASDGWVDILGTVFYPTTGPSAPARATLSAPHANFGFPRFGIGDLLQWEGHLPHLCDPSEGVYLHVHFLVDGTQTRTVKFELEWSYAHGYSREALSVPQIVTLEQAGTGVAKTHQIVELASPILTDAIEPDGLLTCVCKRVTNGGTDVTDPVFVRFFDAHCKLLKMSSANRNYPFE